MVGCSTRISPPQFTNQYQCSYQFLNALKLHFRSCCPRILCEWNAGINFSDIDSVYIGYMRFVGCRGHQAIAIKVLILANTTFT